MKRNKVKKLSKREIAISVGMTGAEFDAWHKSNIERNRKVIADCRNRKLRDR